jgi:hypothetical protein
MMPSMFEHITIATRPLTAVAMRGIGISSQAEWEELQPELYAEHWRDGF